jgi:hypothetical protein
MKIVLCIVIYNIDNIDIIKNTYLKLINSDINYYFILDNKLKKDIYSINDSYIFIKDLNLDTHFSILRYFKDLQYDFISISYENAFININNLILYLNTLNINDELYIGGHGDYRALNTKFWFHSYTSSIILTKNATLLLLDESLMDNYNKLCFHSSDLQNLSGVAIGYFAQLYNIKIINNDNFKFCNYIGYPCHNNNINTAELIACYNMSEEDMYNYYNIIKNDKIKINKMNIIVCPGGGLGNVLFQYFNSYVLKKKYNCNVLYQSNYQYWRGDMNKYRIFKYLEFIDLNITKTDNFIDYNEKDFLYNEYELEQKNYKIFGYYQSYKYSENYIDEIKDDLFFKNNNGLYTSVLNKYNLINSKFKETCLVHVRRGDYLNLQNIHPVCKDDYYIKALKIIPNCKYLIFSDDIQFIKNWSVIKNLDYEIIDINNAEEILIFMSLCDNFIIANSTLSLVAYLLRKNKDAKLVAPKIWFGKDGYKYNIEDIIPNNGILL